MKNDKTMQDKIVLFAFRKSQKNFFRKIMAVCKTAETHIITSKFSWRISFKSLSHLKHMDTRKARLFAIDEFYAKNSVQIPKVCLQVYFNFFAIVNFLRYYTALDAKYNKMLIWNGGKFRQLIALDVAQLLDIQVYYFENGLLPNTIVFDTQGINYNNSVPRDKRFYQTYRFTTKLPKHIVPRIGKNREVFIGEKETLPEKYIFVPFQVDADTQIISYSPWIKNMRALFEIIEYVSKECEYHFILKEHPSSGVEYPDLHKKAKKSPNISFRNTYATQELIENSIAVMTINSTVGIESLLFYKKVIVLGDAFYNIEDITYHAKNLVELRYTLEHIESSTLDNELVDKFLSYLYVDYLVQKNDEMHISFCHKMLQEDKNKEKGQ